MTETLAGFKLSPIQRRMWAVRNRAEARALQLVVAPEGRIERQRLDATLERLVARHEILRTRFERQPGVRVPLQVVLEPPLREPTVAIRSLEVPAELDDEALVAALLEHPSSAAGHLAAELSEDGGVLLEVAIVRRSAGDLLRLTASSLIVDLPSLMRLAAELVGVSTTTPDAGEPLQYVQVSEWLHELAADEEGSTARAAWLDRLAEPEGASPADGPATVAHCRRRLDAGLGAALCGLARQREVHPGSVLLALWKALLVRLGDRGSMLAVAPVLDVRKFDELSATVGPLRLPVVDRVAHGPSHRFEELLSAVESETEAAVEMLEYFPWDAPTARAEALFELVEVPPGLSVLGIAGAGHGVATGLVTALEPTGEILLEVTAAADVPERARHLAEAFQVALQAALARPEIQLGRLPLIASPAGGAAVAEPAGVEERESVVERFERWVERQGDRPAVVAGTEEISYRALEEGSRRLAGALVDLGVTTDDRVALLVRRGGAAVVGLLGVLRAGAAYVPLDPSHPSDRLATLVEGAGCRAVVTDGDLEPPACDGVPIVRLDDLPAAVTGRALPRPVPESLAYVIFTSGSTGRPKAVGVEHRQLASYVDGVLEALELGPGLSYGHLSTFAADLGHTSLFPPLVTGGILHVVPEEALTDPAALADLFARRPIDCLKVVPSHFATLEELAPAGSLLPPERLIFGGEPLRAEWVARLLNGESRTCRIYNHYGPTETTVGVLARRVTPESTRGGSTVPIGRPMGGARAVVVDPRGELVPPTFSGELVVGGPTVSRGYLEQPAATAERFVPDPLGDRPGERLYRTGDRVLRLVSGELVFLGRVDHQVKIRGFRVEPAEVATVLAELPGVREAVVVAADGVDGPSRRLIGYVSADRGEPADPEALRTALARRLPEPMVPARIVVLDRLPLTPNGKVDRAALPEPESASDDPAAEHVAPRTPLESALVKIWSEVLGIERIGVEDRFFALGGDSLHSVRVAALAREQGIELTIQDLFRHQTVAALAVHAESAGTADAEAGVEPFSLLRPEDRERVPAGVVDAFPLTDLQKGMFFHMEETPDSPAYHNVYSFHLRAPFDREALERSLDRVVAHYPMLRSSIHLARFSEPLQMVWEAARLVPVVEDLRHLDAAEQQRVIDETVAALRHRLFDPTRPPLWRFHLHRRTDESFQLTMAECHPVSDGWSTNATLAEIFEQYIAHVRGEEPPPLAPVTVSYGEIVRLERAALESEESRRYWQETLADVVVTRLPRRGDRPAEEAGIARFNFPLPDALRDGLQELARRAGTPLRSVGLTAHLEVLSILSGSSDVITALLVDARPEMAGGDRLRGLALNTVPFRSRIGVGSWTERIREVFRLETELHAHRRYPLSEIQRHWGGDKLLETFFAYLNFRSLETVARSGEIELLSHGNAAISETDFPLCSYLWMDPPPSSLAAIILTADLEILSERQVREIYGYYLRTLQTMVEHPEEHRGAFTPLAAAERTALLAAGRSQTQLVPRRFTELFEAAVNQRADAVAVALGEERLTYRQLDRQTRALSAVLCRRLARRDRAEGNPLVGLLFERGLDFVEAVVATLGAGAGYLPLDVGHPPARLAQVLETSRVPLVVVAPELAERVREASELFDATERPEIATLDELRAAVASDDPEAPRVEVADQALAYVIFTSGSTGRPKGAMIHHAGMDNHLAAKIDLLDLASGDVVAQPASQCFDISVWQMLAPLAVGARMEIFPDAVAQDPWRLARELVERGVTVFETVPSMLDMLLAEGVLAADEELPELRVLLATGEALPPELARRWLERFERVPVVNAYGPTECSDDVSHHLVAEPPPPEATGVPIGSSVPGLALHVVDRFQRLLPAGVAGELQVGGVGVGRGYLGAPALTADAFVPDPFGDVPGARLYRTGDLVRRPTGGALQFLGRLDHQVKIRGFRVELEELEAVLARRDGVRQAVAAVRDEGGEATLVAYVVADGDRAPTASELRRYLEERLPGYMVPAAFAVLERLPLTANGKVDRAALPAPSLSGGAAAIDHVPPRTPTEQFLAELWKQVLGVPRVSAEDDFFELGGHSILAAQLVFKMREVFDVELPMASLFASTRLDDLAAAVDHHRREQSGLEAPPIEPVSRDRAIPQSLAQQRLWLVDRMERGSLAYSLREAVRLTGECHLSALDRAFAELVHRHEPLRTTFGLEGRQPVQWVHPFEPRPLPVIDLSGLPARIARAETWRLANSEGEERFDLERGPLFRVRLLRVAPDDHVVLLTLHHIIGDGASMEVIVDEVSALYRAYSTGSEVELPELDVQFADYVAWQNRWLEEQGFERLLTYWRQKLAGAPPVLDLSIARPRPERPSFRGASASLELPASLGRRIEDLAQREEVTLFMLLLAAWKALLARYSEREDMVVGADVAGRDRPETARMVGFFVNELVLRTDLSGDPSFGDLLARVRTTCLDAYLHQDLPFVKLVEELAPERRENRMPLFQVSLGLRYADGEGDRGGGLGLSKLALEHRWTRMDLSLNIVHRPDGLSLWALHDAALFAPETIDRLLATYRRLLELVVERPSVRLSEMHALVDAADRQAIEAVESRLAAVRQNKFGRLGRRGGRSERSGGAE